MNTTIPMRLEHAVKPQFEQRLQQFRQALGSSGQHGALLFAPEHMRYLLNYSGEAAMAVVTKP